MPQPELRIRLRPRHCADVAQARPRHAPDTAQTRTKHETAAPSATARGRSRGAWEPGGRQPGPAPSESAPRRRAVPGSPLGRRTQYGGSPRRALQTAVTSAHGRLDTFAPPRPAGAEPIIRAARIPSPPGPSPSSGPPGYLRPRLVSPRQAHHQGRQDTLASGAEPIIRAARIPSPPPRLAAPSPSSGRPGYPRPGP